jgi:dTDP-glucose pyrophosphorylase
MKALILAAGRGSRLNKFTKNRNKSMINLFEKPLIEYNLKHAVSGGVDEIIIVVGYKKEEIMQFIGDTYQGVPVKYVFQKEQRGLVHAIECSKEILGDSDFLLMLGDEIIPKAKIKNMIKKFRKEDLFAICGIVHEEDKLSLRKTYSAMVNKEGRIFRLIEKPKISINNIKGTGHCIFKNEILDYINRTPIHANRGEKELVDLIQVSVDDGKKVFIYTISQVGYVNINTKEDYNLAKEIIKENFPRVLIVHTQMKFLGGAELLITELANWLTRKGIKNDILALSKSKEVENKLIDTKIIIPNHDIDLAPPGFKNIKDILKFIIIYQKKLRKIKKNYDVINFHNFPVTWTLWPKKKPCVWMLNEPPNLWSKPQANFILKLLNKFRNILDKKIIQSSVDVICVADEFNKKRAKKRYRRNAKIVYYGVNYEFFSKGKAINAIKKFDLKKKFVVLQSGMITESKNQLRSIEAISKIKNKIPEVFLVLAGKVADENYKKSIDVYIKEHKLEKNILFTGNLERTDLRDLYKACNVGLFPIGEQGGWLAPFELLCSGNPIIVSEDLGAASVIKKHNLGTVTKNYENALIKIYEKRKEYKKQAKDSSLFVKKNLGWDIFTDKMINAFNFSLKNH